MKYDSSFNIKVVDLFERFPSSQISSKSEYCAASYDFSNIKAVTRLLFIRFSDEVGNASADFYCSQNELKSATGLPDSPQACMIFKVKLATGSLTLNSTQKKTKVDIWFNDFALVFVRRAFSEVDVPVADYEQCKVSIGSTDFHLNSVQ